VTARYFGGGIGPRIEQRLHHLRVPVPGDQDQRSNPAAGPLVDDRWI
jgi:hypothetical protein